MKRRDRSRDDEGTYMFTLPLDLVERLKKIEIDTEKDVGSFVSDAVLFHLVDREKMFRKSKIS